FESHRAAHPSGPRLRLDLDFALGVPRAHDGGFPRVAAKPGIVDVCLGTVARRRPRRRGGGRDRHDGGHVAAGRAILGLGTPPAAGGLAGMIEIRGLSKRFTTSDGAVRALDSVDLTIADKEFFVLLGLSGSGKTTLLRCAAGLEKPDAGEILFNGR